MTNKAKEKEHTVEPLLKDTSEIRTQTLDRVPTLYKYSSPGTRTSFGPKGVPRFHCGSKSCSYIA